MGPDNNTAEGSAKGALLSPGAESLRTTAKDIFSSVVGAYVLITLCVFPVFTTDMYFNILVDKYYFYLVSTIGATAILLVLTAVFAFIDSKEYSGENIRRITSGMKPRSLIKSLSVPDICVLIFFLVSGLSTICSEWLYEAFWGNMGRYSGFFLWIWYVVMYFLVTRFFRFKKIYLDAFILVGLYVCIWGIQDYFQLDPHGFLENVEAVDKDIFTSSIGNINTYTAWVAIYMAVSSTLFIVEGNGLFAGFKNVREMYGETHRGSGRVLTGGSISDGRSSERNSLKNIFCIRTRLIFSDIRMLFYLISTCIFFTALIMGQSDNSVLSIAALLCFLPFLAWKNRDGFIRYIIVLAAFAGSMWFAGAVSTKYADMVLPPDNGSMLISMSYKPFWKDICLGLCGFAIALIIIMAVVSVRRNVANTSTEKNHNGKTGTAENHRESSSGLYLCNYRNTVNKPLPNIIRFIWLALGIIAAGVIIWLFWDANHGGHPEWYAPYSNIMYFNINWGTHRGHNWGILMRHFSEFPLWKKLIGSGPETYGIVTRVFDYYEMKDTFGEIYDSAHNEYLQYLFTTGIIGLVSYLGWLSSGVFNIFTKVKHLPWAKACAFAVIAYGFQAFVNITVPIVVPVFLLMLAMGLAALREERQEKCRE